MKILNNIYRCKTCGIYAIAEEKDLHVCSEVKNVRVEGDIRWISDGSKWYPLKLNKNASSTENLHGEDQPQNGQNQIRSNFYAMNAL